MAALGGKYCTNSKRFQALTMSSDLPTFPFARNDGVEPAAMNAKLRHDAPITKVKLFDGTPAWIVMKHKDCCAALENPKLSADRRVDGYPEIHSGGHKAKEARPTFVNLDDPDHAKQRAMVENEFSRETVETKWRPFMEKTIDKVLDDFVQKGKQQQPIDFVAEFATPIPTQIIYKVLGIPEKDVEPLAKDSEIRNSTSRNAAETANKSLQEYMAGLVKEKIQQPGDDLISTLIREQYQHGNLTEEDVTTLAFLVLTAGNAALINTIALGTMTLLQHPDQLEAFKREPEKLASRVVNEITRFHTASALNCRRVAKEDMRIGDQDIKKGEGVICAVQAANRDEDKFKDPESFNIWREMSLQHSLGFGWGQHRSQAEIFSRVQLELVFINLFKRLPNLRLVKQPDQLPYTEPTMNIGVLEMPVYLE